MERQTPHHSEIHPVSMVCQLPFHNSKFSSWTRGEILHRDARHLLPRFGTSRLLQLQIQRWSEVYKGERCWHHSGWWYLGKCCTISHSWWHISNPHCWHWRVQHNICLHILYAMPRSRNRPPIASRTSQSRWVSTSLSHCLDFMSMWYKSCIV